MKKIIMVAAIVCAAVASHAASFKWSASNIVGTDNTGTYSGTATLQAMLNSAWTDVATATVTDGAIKASQTQFSSDKFTPATDYDFRFVITDGKKSFTSNTVTVMAQGTDIATIKFSTQASKKWEGGDEPGPEPIPEPTSGLLIALGIAGLTLRRKTK